MIRFARWAMLIALVIGGAAHAQVEIRSTGAADTRTRVAVPPPVAPAGLEAEAMTIAEVVAYDLNFSGLFNVLGSEYYPPGFRALPDEASRIDLASWATTPVESLVYLKLTEAGGEIAVECRLFDVASAQQVVGRQLQERASWLRLMGHMFSDEVVLAASGVAGIATSQICYSSGAAGNKEIYIADYDGANVRQVTKHGDISIKPKFSPDGKKIAYVSYKDRGQYLYLLDLASGESRSLSARPGMNSAPSWSPDGSHLAVALSRDGNPEIYRIDAAGGELQRLTTHIAVDTSPTYSPDGRRIAFVSERLGRPQIFVMDASGQGVDRLSYQGGSAYDPVWSPDGKWLAYVAEAPGEGLEIYVLDPSNKQTYYRLTDSAGSNESPSWSADSRHLIFASTRGGQMQLWTVNLQQGIDAARKGEPPVAKRVPNIGQAEGSFWGPRR